MDIKDRVDASDEGNPEKIGAILKIDPELIRKGGDEAAPVIAGIHFYRQLDGRTQTKVLEGLAKLEDSHPELAAALRERHADILVQPRWHPWSMADKELGTAVEDNAAFRKWLQRGEDVVKGAAAIGTAVNPATALPWAAATGATKISRTLIDAALESEAGKLQAELDRRGTPKKK